MTEGGWGLAQDSGTPPRVTHSKPRSGSRASDEIIPQSRISELVCGVVTAARRLAVALVFRSGGWAWAGIWLLRPAGRAGH